MKSYTFPNQKTIFEHLLNGGSVIYKQSNVYYKFTDDGSIGMYITTSGEFICYTSVSFSECGEYGIFVEKRSDSE